MNVLITGGAGFLGRRLCAALLKRGELTDSRGQMRAIARIRLFDVVAVDHDDPRVESLIGDIANADDVRAALGDTTDSVFHLAAVVSGEAEQNFDLGMRVNVDGTRVLLEACRALGQSKGDPPKVIFTSSLAVFGGPLPDPVPDAWPLTPQSSYGAQKAIGELLLNDMSRKGFIDGRALRLPTICVRPGRPNKAASSFLSSIIREPLNGVEAICPVEPSLRVWLLSPRRAIENLILAHELPATAFGHTRSINVPGLSVSVGEMVQALRDVAGDAVANRVRFRRDDAIERIVASWPAAFTATFGRALGMQADSDFASIVRAYLEDECR
ncbi:MAG: D-erythronate dehydrogenase [Candidatus Brachytrichaceae bacterium NZ_4S206]|jgi:nucleoside-diphosphate-sugar epimerase